MCQGISFIDTTMPRFSPYIVSIALLAILTVLPAGSSISQVRDRWKLDCIVIDPGHGGKDPGTIGVTGVKEKHIVLKIALKLGALIEEHLPGIKVVYTRKDDRFIELYKRGKIANEAKGKLFVSIHCNSLEQKPSKTHGFEVYLLRPGRTDEAIRIAEVENSVVRLEEDYEERYKELDEEAFILINMAQSAYAKHSEKFAALLSRRAELSPKMKNLGVKQAGFYVLVGASMPAVLVESGFLSNTKEEKFLSSDLGQSHIAYLLYYGIKDFVKYYEEHLNE
ncbi:MAG: hypothetical protein CL946_12270 [Ectothiorhodospiraceae bacterium]|nr:hypothetical protein [Ectothiorhodospiraceae bacterium]